MKYVKTYALALMAVAGIMGMCLAQDAEDAKKNEALAAKISEAARQAFVEVKVEFQKDPEDADMDDESMYYYSNKQSMDLSGILLKDGLVLMKDRIFLPKTIKKITIKDYLGQTYVADMHKTIIDAPAVLLKIRDWSNVGQGVVFAEAGEPAKGRKLFSASMFRSDEESFINVMPAMVAPVEPFAKGSATRPWAVMMAAMGDSGNDRGRLVSPSSIIYNEEGLPIGFPVTGKVEIGGNKYLWKGSDIVNGKAITAEEFTAQVENLKKVCLSQMLEVKFVFRQKEKDENQYGGGFARYGRSSNYSGPEYGGDTTDVKLYGILLDGKRIFIPHSMPKAFVNRIEKIEVLQPAGGSVPAKFNGSFKDFSGLMVELEGKPMQQTQDIYAAERPELLRLMFTFRVYEKFAKRFEKIHYARFGRIEKGYKDEPVLGFMGDEPPLGSFLFDASGAPFGVVLDVKKDIADKMSSGDHYYSSGSETKTYLFKELRGKFERPDAEFDKAFVPLSDREMKRIIWIGVEFQGLDKDLAEHLNCAKQTREGNIGILVTHIYAGSPAEKAGLVLNDVILKLQEKDKDTPIEMSMNDYSYRGYDDYDDDYFSGGRSGGARGWKDTRNFLNLILTEIGEGKTVVVTYLRDGKELSAEFVLEKAPYDFESAEKHLDEKIGLTVRDVTYEIRYGMRLPPEFSGVIVSKVKEGSKSDIAGIRTFELLTKIEEIKIGSVGDLKKTIEELYKDPARAKIRLTLEIMGKSRFVDVNLKD